ALRRLAFTMTVDNLDAEEKGALEERLYREELVEVRGQIKQVARWDGPLRLFLDDLAAKVGILGPHDGEDAEWKFWHRTFKEALTAEHLASLSDDELLEQVAGLAGQESRWAEPYALVTGQVDEPDALVRKLVAVNRPLGLRALATAQGVSDATFDEVLELTDALKERAKVLERLPTTVGDAERALKLIDRLRQRTRDGFDLFWLHLAADRVAEMDSDYAESVRDLQGRFFEHIPAPDPELFQSFQTADGETKPLWCEIPAGRYWVGSLESEPGRDDNEVRHQVDIRHPYRIAAITVTNRQYAAFDPELAPNSFKGVSNDDLFDHPRVGVSWCDAVSFCRWLSTVKGLEDVRLPWDPEWAVACRARTETAYWSGNSKAHLDRLGWFQENSGGRTHRVAETPANEFELYDAHGNVLEWLLDPFGYQGSPMRAWPAVQRVDPSAPPDDLAGPSRSRLARGGSFADPTEWVRSAWGAYAAPWERSLVKGFRVVLPLPPADGRS
ncbi:MAG: formylglycine-generating enzyme family protein, partial [Acidobacteriota bacterium]